MGTIDRPIKRGDVFTFDDSYNKGFKNIWASEVDAEFDNLYNTWNSGTVNIADGSITGDKLVDGSITGAKLAPDSVGSGNIINGTITTLDLNDVLQNLLPPAWSPGEHDRVLAIDSTGQYLVWVAAPPAAPGGPAGGDLAGSTYPNPVIAPLVVSTGKIADLAVTPEKLADLAVTPGKLADLAVSKAKIAVGAALGASLGYTNTGQGGSLFASQSTETTLGAAATITTRGGPILIFAEFTGWFTLNAKNQYSGTWEWYIRRDTAITGTIIRNISYYLIWPGIVAGSVIDATGSMYIPFRLSTMILDTTHNTPGTYSYYMSYKVVSSATAITAEYNSTQRGITLVELS